MLIKNVSTLLGKELDFISNTNIKIQDGRFKRIQPNIGSSAKEESFDCEGLLLIPGFVN
jgi:dihydroorotase-like cyclic amidohydrolase